MSKEHAISRAKIQAIKASMQLLAVQIEKEHGVKLTMGRCQFGDIGRVVFDVLPIGADGEPTTREARAFRELAHVYGLKADDLGKTFDAQGKTFEVTGLASRGQKFPILAKCTADGKTYKFQSEFVARILGTGTGS